jgi:predicted acetyltransferase
MARHPESPSTQIEVVPAAPDEEPILANLLELYAHDFSEFHEIKLGHDGRFGYKDLALYWREPGRHPFLIRVDGNLAGLVLVQRGSEFPNNEIAWDMAEFFVVRGYRKRGVGIFVAHEVWMHFPGRWEVRVMESNDLAHRFWERAISAFTGETVQARRVENGGKPWRVFEFESKLVS